jgi:hypothetical protein
MPDLVPVPSPVLGVGNSSQAPPGSLLRSADKERIEGRKAVRYDYRWPRALGGFEINMTEGRGNVGEQGSFWADPQSLDLIRIFSHAVEVPAELPVQARRITVSYASTGSVAKLGGGVWYRGGACRSRPLTPSRAAIFPVR